MSIPSRRSMPPDRKAKFGFFNAIEPALAIALLAGYGAVLLVTVKPTTVTDTISAALALAQPRALHPGPRF